ncbi:hypothetical protein MYU51_018233 [Penicillium brevicompactum]|uniref:uncharacterized protein n=1 Tax=Penicillium brevicompactum TaxID=5074 RepID=UPI002541CC53|nr:uncharacterized protein N7506_003520 [Penicillium brevicompactum]KAJ5343696.1 hypothetical protein N7506_003520 [Penicillium brevicompactum]
MAGVVSNQAWVHNPPLERIPVAILNRIVSECHLDILNHGPGANHAILRLMFRHPQAVASQHAPAGTTGVKVDLAVNGRIVPGPIASELAVKTFTYIGPNIHASHSAEILVVGEKRVNDFLKVLESAKLLPCSFDYVLPDAVGCRDFISQYIFQLEMAKVLRIPALSDLYKCFNFRYPAPGVSGKVASPVPRALFGNAAFVHIAVPGVLYVPAPGPAPPAALAPAPAPAPPPPAPVKKVPGKKGAGKGKKKGP